MLKEGFRLIESEDCALTGHEDPHVHGVSGNSINELGVRALVVLWLSDVVGACLIGVVVKSIVVPDLFTSMVETHCGQRDMGDTVVKVDDTLIVTKEGHKVIGEGLVTWARRAIRVEFEICWVEFCLDVKQSESCLSSTERVAGYDNCGS